MQGGARRPGCQTDGHVGVVRRTGKYRAADADTLCFTITTLTTTGFGDITLAGPAGRLISVLIMIVGVSLFLLQTIFRPHKVRFECPDCALRIHDRDAVHCKHCGRVLPIPDDGAV